jgi:predicted enzyme related to lactoylglutathione lyase
LQSSKEIIVAENIKLVVYPVKDLTAAKKFFSKFLGVEPYVDGEWYVGYRVDGQEIGLDPNGTDVIGYVEVKDIKSSVQGLVEAGGKVKQDVKEVGGGLLIAQIEDADGNVVGLRQQP